MDTLQFTAPVDDDHNNDDWKKKKNYRPAALVTVLLLGLAFWAGHYSSISSGRTAPDGSVSALGGHSTVESEEYSYYAALWRPYQFQQATRSSQDDTPTTQCAGNYGTNVPCCSQEGTGTVSPQYQCPQSKPNCVNYVYNEHWGTCVAACDGGCP